MSGIAASSTGSFDATRSRSAIASVCASARTAASSNAAMRPDRIAHVPATITESTCSGPPCCTNTSAMVRRRGSQRRRPAAARDPHMARCNPSNLVLQAQRRGTALRCGREHLRWARPRVEVAALSRQHQREAHRCEMIVPAAGIGEFVAQGDSNTARGTPRQPQHTAAEHQVAGRVMADRDVVAGKHLEVRIGRPDPMRAGQRAVQQAVPLHFGQQPAGPARIQRGLRARVSNRWVWTATP